MDGSEYNTVSALMDQQNTAKYARSQHERKTLSGTYLSSRFAQRHHDWAKATDFINTVMELAPEDFDLVKRAMVLGMGSGKIEVAMGAAREVLKQEPDNSLALLFIAASQFKDQDYQQGAATIAAMPDGSLSNFIMPLLHSWAQASLGINDTADLKGSVLHIYHAILIADFLGETDTVETLLAQSLTAPDISTDDLVRIASIYGHIGDVEQAKALYEKTLLIEPDNIEAAQNLELIKNNGDLKIFDKVDTAEEGMAQTLFDMARVLYSDYSDESARIFAHLAYYLNPDNMDVVMLLGNIAARNDRFDDAITFYRSVPADDPKYFDARRLAANLLEDNDRVDEALAALQELVATHDNIDALIQIGDIYRRNDDFKNAVEVYNQVEEKLGGTIPADYWQIYYVRGMGYEQLGEWALAEKDLKTALKFQPDHPFVLNYLGYSWADQGINLKESRDMIQRAVNLRPEDGYITDSLGWVLYRMGAYKDAVPHLERAVELLPYDPVVNDHLGDAYWKVGRRLEARFQWERAKNNSDDQALIQTVTQKIEHGLDQPNAVSKAADAAHIMSVKHTGIVEQ